MRLSRDLDIECPYCYKASKLGSWNDLSYEKCSNREMKRAFKHLNDPKAFEEKSDRYYICPKCGKWVGGWALKIVNTADEALKKLGGKAVLKVLSYKTKDGKIIKNV